MKKIIYLFLISKIAFGQIAKLDSNIILIGEQINFQISNDIDKTEFWPSTDFLFKEGIEIIKEGKIDTNKNIISQSFIITAWDSGSYYIPSVEFSPTNSTEGLLLNVQTL